MDVKQKETVMGRSEYRVAIDEMSLEEEIGLLDELDDAFGRLKYDIGLSDYNNAEYFHYTGLIGKYGFTEGLEDWGLVKDRTHLLKIKQKELTTRKQQQKLKQTLMDQAVEKWNRYCDEGEEIDDAVDERVKGLEKERDHWKKKYEEQIDINGLFRIIVDLAADVECQSQKNGRHFSDLQRVLWNKDAMEELKKERDHWKLKAESLNEGDKGMLIEGLERIENLLKTQMT